MNKFAIPALLTSIVLIAGIFSFMPVDKASTVHTSLTSVISINVDIDDVEDGTTFEIDCTEPFFIPQLYIDSSGVPEADTIRVADLLIDGNALDVATGNFETLDEEFEDFYADMLDEGDFGSGLGAEDTFAFDFDDGQDDADDPITVIAIVITNGTCDATLE